MAKFLTEDDKTEQRYKWKKDKQLQAAKIHKVFSLDEQISKYNDITFGNVVEDTVNQENKNPLIIVLENEYNEEMDYEYRCTMNPKQYEVVQYHLKGYSNTEIAKKINIDESSVRERLHNALRVTVTSYLIHTNNELFRFVKNEVVTTYGSNLPQENTFNKTLAFMFFNRLHFSRPDLHDMISFAIDEDYKDFQILQIKPPKKHRHFPLLYRGINFLILKADSRLLWLPAFSIVLTRGGGAF